MSATQKQATACALLAAGLSLLIFRQMPSVSFLAALAIMLAGAYCAASDQP